MFNLFKKNKKIVTHNLRFHPDDIFACATLSLYLDKNKFKYEIIRTRDPEIIQKADFVADVGGIYDASLNRFDHHQKEGAGNRENGIPYAAFGLVWGHYGKDVSGSKEVAEMIDKKIAQPIDAEDNGMAISSAVVGDVQPYDIYDIVSSFLPEDRGNAKEYDKNFLKLVEWAKSILLSEIKHGIFKIKSAEKVKEIYEASEDKRIIVVEGDYNWKGILEKYKEPLFVIMPYSENWAIATVREDQATFKNRKDFPESWGGLEGEALQKVTGIPEAIFCHRKLFLTIAKSKEGAIKLAKLALGDRT